MIGNLNEWTDEWYAGLGTTLAGYRPWPQEAGNFGMDLVTNIDSKAYPRAGRMPELGIPSAAMRGGAADGGTAVGIYHLLLNFAPSATENLVGFRCVIRR
jgi:formylglycine-generating enzyme required for sulfatase activity